MEAMNKPESITVRRDGRVWRADINWLSGARWMSWGEAKTRNGLETMVRDRLASAGFPIPPFCYAD